MGRYMPPHQRGAGRGRSSSAARGPAESSSADAAATWVAEARREMQRAERRGGAEGLKAIERACRLFQAAAESRGAGRPGDSAADADGPTLWAELGDALQLRAELLLQAAREDDGPNARAVHLLSRTRAAELLREAVTAYERALGPPGPPPNDALAACGNALCALAPVCGNPAVAAEALSCARDMYLRYLEATPEAAMARYLGECLVAAGEGAAARGDGPAAAAAFAEARGAYSRACSLCDSAMGDDLPALLYDWAVGLHAMAGFAGSAEERRALLEEAERRLREAGEFGRGDPDVFNALGEVYMAAAEGAGGEEAEALARRALAEGYEAALRIDASNADALVGRAEVAVFLGRAAAARGDAAGAAGLMRAAVEAYGAALRDPAKVGDFEERSAVRYNAACAMAMAGDREGAAAALTRLLASGGTTAEEVAADAELRDVASMLGLAPAPS